MQHAANDATARRRGRPSVDEAAAIDRRILAEAAALFVEVGVASAQMEQIAARACVSKAALYRRYASKTDLMHAIVDTFAETSFMLVDEVRHHADALIQLKATMRRYREHRREPAQVALHRLMIAAVPRHPEIGTILDRMRVRYVRPVDDLIARAMCDRLICQMPVIPLREAMFDLLVNGAASQMLYGMTPDTEDDIFDLRWDTLMSGVATCRLERGS